MFRDREDAGRQLARLLEGRALREPLVLAIPRGGVVTGAELAKAIGAELDVVLVRKLHAPFEPELAIGAVSEEGLVHLAPHARLLDGVDDAFIAAERDRELSEIARRSKLFRAVRAKARITGRSVVVTDDGIATGSTMIAALQVVRSQGPRELIAAVPVAPHSHLQEIRRWCNEVACVITPAFFVSIGQFYADFDQVDDQRVLEILAACQPAAGPPG